MGLPVELDIYQSVTDRIISALEAGTAPWVRPWSTLGDVRPRNGLTGHVYRGINTWVLSSQAQALGYASPRWLTFRQAVTLGGRVRRGEHGTRVVYFRMTELPDRAAPVPSASSNGVSTRVVPLLRTFTAFNLAQIEGLPASMVDAVPEPPAWIPETEAERLITASGAQIRHGGDRAYYQPSLDHIQLPLPKAFADAGSYYGTALHELTHWTGHPSRCARSLTGRFGDAAYAMEELIAEMGAAYLCAHCGIDGQLQHPAYLARWLRVLRADKRAIFTAATRAQQAADHLVGGRDEDARVMEAVQVA